MKRGAIAARTVWGALLLMCLSAGDTLAWWNDEWQFRKKITLDGDAVGVAGTDDLTDVPVLIRLHSGNFSYFLDTRADGGDLRFVAGDDTTPLPFHVENYDPLLGIANLWVKAPALGTRAVPQEIYLYYGAAEAKPAADAAATFDTAHTAVFHFREKEGLPRDATAYGHHANDSTLQAGETGAIDLGVRLDGSGTMSLPDTPALDAGGADGFTASMWLLPEAGGTNGRVLSEGDAGGRFELGLREGRLYARLGPDEAPVEVEAPQALASGRWQHVAVTIDATQLRLFVSGREAASAPVARGPLAGPLTVGATDGTNGLRGGLDELQISNLARSSAWIAAIANAQGADSTLYTFFEDTAAEGEGLAAAYLQLLRVTVQKLSLDGWTIIGLILLLGLISGDVMVGKALTLARTERADKRFLQQFRQQERDALSAAIVAGAAPADATAANSTLSSLYATAVEATAGLLAETRSARLSPQAIDALRSAIDIRLVEETNRLNSRLVLVTIAVSGAPFLGLLGTVVGVMITFTSVAASGDVNVSTIAPGVASAMATTVMGLVIAIPSMFGYNFLASRAARIITVMEVFAEQLVARIATLGEITLPETGAPESPHAT